MAANENARAIVVGVRPTHHEHVVGIAASLAVQLHVGLVCVWVDPAQIDIGIRPDGTELTEYIDPDVAEERPPAFPDDARENVARIAARHGVVARFEAHAGAAERALAAVAERVDAPMIVVGSRDGRSRRAVREFFNGSVAARLTHRQHRPVLVVPLDPVGFDQPLPWQTE
jgi:nucleotide-binding universal stress UspA family protein